MSAIEIRIPGRPPTPNSRRHWRRVHADNTYWRNYAMQRATRYDGIGFRAPIDKATLAIEFVVPDKRHRDLDNLIASTKPLTDGIVAAGVLLDDSADVLVSVTYSVRYAKGESATVYRITPLDVAA